ncbi:S41 family peptidase [Flavobacterium collinsii]|uniref:TSPc domain-containing protein n=1 Tax=Flavobacterium collinsii TaxID=1114861 RepID=A0A9W4TF93_9FLAO|nr:S41 family peptidase [Flavobacterium collinsii]CAI2766925.1 TSPc domain-containing protein [Flavobacterium collinsii]
MYRTPITPPICFYKQTTNTFVNPKNLRSVFTLLLLFFFSCTIQAQSFGKTMKDSLMLYNKMLSQKQMQEDLRTLLAINEKANSGLYQYRSKKQIDHIYNSAIKSIKKPMSTIEFYKIMLRLSDYEGSLHNYTIPDLGLINFLNRQKSFFPFPLVYINGQIIFDGQSSDIPPGSRIKSINGINDVQLMRSFYKYYTTDGHHATQKLSASVNKSFGLNYLLEYGLCDEFVIEYSAPKSESLKKTVLRSVTLKERTANLKNRFSAPVTDLLDYKKQPPYSFRMINPTLGLLNLRFFGMAYGSDDPKFKPYVRFLDSIFTELDKNKVANLIIDVRNNPGGSDPNFEQPVMYLTDKPFKENVKATIIFDPNVLPLEKYFWGTSTSERMDSTALKAGKEYLKSLYPVFENKTSFQNQKYNPVYHPKSPLFKGKLYLLINENVASAASHFASLVKAYVDNVTIVGLETVGGYYVHNGHSPLVYELPNSKVKTQFSIVNVVQDAPKKENQPEGHGIMPDYEVWPSLDDFFQQKDTQMEFVLKLIAK